MTDPSAREYCCTMIFSQDYCESDSSLYAPWPRLSIYQTTWAQNWRWNRIFDGARSQFYSSYLHTSVPSSAFGTATLHFCWPRSWCGPWHSLATESCSSFRTRVPSAWFCKYRLSENASYKDFCISWLCRPALGFYPGRLTGISSYIGVNTDHSSQRSARACSSFASITWNLPFWLGPYSEGWRPKQLRHWHLYDLDFDPR